MTMEWLQANWALIAGSILVLAIALQGLYRLARASRAARLAAAGRVLAGKRADLGSAARAVDKARRRLDGLLARADSVRPMDIEEARGRLSDAEALHKIAEDQVLIAANQLRRIIVEEFPPRRQEALRRRYLGEEGGDRRPFSF